MAELTGPGFKQWCQGFVELNWTWHILGSATRVYSGWARF